MKKIIAVALALVMVLAISVPAFAVVEINKGTQPQQAEVPVSTQLKEGQDSVYTVSIPASIPVDWNTSETDADYDVTTNLLAGAKLTVSVVASANGEMTSSLTTDKLTLSVVNGEPQSFVGVNSTPAAHNAVKVQISGFDAAAPGEYTGTLTYRVAYQAPVIQ